VSSSSPTGTQFLQAVGCAEAARYRDPRPGEVTLVSSGEGATSEGEFWEAINAACLESLPVIFLIQDNGWAISVPVEHETPGGDISRLVSGHPNLRIFRCEGSDFAGCYATMAEAVNYCRRERKPALVHALCTRPYSHSLSDDDRLYKTEAERVEEGRHDPVPIFADWLVASGAIDRKALDQLMQEVDLEVQEASDRASKATPPPKGAALRYLYSESVDPTSSAFDTEPQFSGEPRTMVDSINLTLSEEMHRDPRVIVFGEDVADCSRVESLKQVKGKGGVFKVTQGLQTAHGSERVFNTPIAEAAIVGRAAGMAIHGLKPVVEIQFFDYIWPAMMQIRNELATLRWRSNGGFSCPLTLRVPIGGYLNGGAIYHSQSGEVEFTHIPGLRVVMPSNALDACGLLRTAIRCDDPVMFLEHKHLYRQTYNKSEYPGKDFMIPFGKASLRRDGSSRCADGLASRVGAPAVTTNTAPRLTMALPLL
jgi:2-oxoisovalerate dehydrogenase E1 component